MTVRITIAVDGTTHKVVQPYDGADRAHVPSLATCPRCARKADDAGLAVAGYDKHIASHDTYQAHGYALCCRQALGTITATVSTIFGLHEDEAVLVRGRCRVY